MAGPALGAVVMARDAYRVVFAVVEYLRPVWENTGRNPRYQRSGFGLGTAASSYDTRFGSYSQHWKALGKDSL